MLSGDSKLFVGLVLAAGLQFGAPIQAEVDAQGTGSETVCMTADEFLSLSDTVAEALVSDCDTGTPYCVAYTGSIGTGSAVADGSPVRIRYSAWVVPDIAQVTARGLLEFDVTSAPVRDRPLRLMPGAGDFIGLDTVLLPRGAEPLRVGAVIWVVMPDEIAGALSSDLPELPTRGGVAARIELLP